MDDPQFFTFFMSMISQVKLFHWSTMSYAKHKALDDLHSDLSDNVDKLVEVYIARYKKQPLTTFNVNTIATTNTNEIDKYLTMNRDIIDKIQTNYTSEIQNILQEIMANLDRAIYLCKLN